MMAEVYVHMVFAYLVLVEKTFSKHATVDMSFDFLTDHILGSLKPNLCIKQHTFIVKLCLSL